MSPDGGELAWARKVDGDDPTRQGVRIWDLQRDEPAGRIDTRAVYVEFDPTGKTIATVRMLEGTVEVWDATTLGTVATLVGPAIVDDVDFSDDGARIATAGQDGAIRLWDPTTGVEQLALRADGTTLRGVDLGPGGSQLVSTANDGMVRVWALDLDDLIPIAEARLTRGLHDDECRQYLHLERCPRRDGASDG